ncbi:unnamed protein product, partial [Scytosiphon promiscuus]
YIVNTGTLFGVSCRVSRVYGFMGVYCRFGKCLGCRNSWIWLSLD